MAGGAVVPWPPPPQRRRVEHDYGRPHTGGGGAVPLCEELMVRLQALRDAKTPLVPLRGAGGGDGGTMLHLGLGAVVEDATRRGGGPVGALLDEALGQVRDTLPQHLHGDIMFRRPPGAQGVGSRALDVLVAFTDTDAGDEARHLLADGGTVRLVLGGRRYDARATHTLPPKCDSWGDVTISLLNLPVWCERAGAVEEVLRAFGYGGVHVVRVWQSVWAGVRKSGAITALVRTPRSDRTLAGLPARLDMGYGDTARVVVHGPRGAAGAHLGGEPQQQPPAPSAPPPGARPPPAQPVEKPAAAAPLQPPRSPPARATPQQQRRPPALAPVLPPRCTRADASLATPRPRADPAPGGRQPASAPARSAPLGRRQRQRSAAHARSPRQHERRQPGGLQQQRQRQRQPIAWTAAAGGDNCTGDAAIGPAGGDKLPPEVREAWFAWAHGALDLTDAQYAAVVNEAWTAWGTSNTGAVLFGRVAHGQLREAARRLYPEEYAPDDTVRSPPGAWAVVGPGGKRVRSPAARLGRPGKAARPGLPPGGEGVDDHLDTFSSDDDHMQEAAPAPSCTARAVRHTGGGACHSSLGPAGTARGPAAAP